MTSIQYRTSALLCGALMLLHTFSNRALAQTATINSSTTYQTIDGWGASTGYAESNANVDSAQADCFFLYSSNGSCDVGSGVSIGLSWIRIQDNNTANGAPDLPTLQSAVARGASVLLGFNPTVALSSSNYASLASYDVAKIQYFQAQGITISAVSPVNEPQYMGNGSTTAAEIDTFIADYLWPAMNSAGVGSIPLIMPENSGWFATDYATACINDTDCSSHVPVVAQHGYWDAIGNQGADGFSGGYMCCADYAAVTPPSSVASKRLWMTEVNGGESPCPGTTNLAAYNSSMGDALVYAHNIHDFLTGSNGAWTPYGSAWFYWNLESAGPGSGASGSCNDGLTDDAFNPAQRYYAIGNFSKFVRPGQVRIAATPTPQTNVYVTAFMNQSTGAFEIVAINENSNTISQSFSLSGVSTTSVTPWITSASLDLTEQTAVPVTSGSFTFTLPASSVTTFVGNGNASPGPPTGLSAAIVQ